MSETEEFASGPKPRVRAGAIAWGLIVCAIAGTVLAISTSPANRAAYAEWAGGLTDGAIGLGVVLALGFLALLLGLLAVIRRAQRG